MVGLSDLGPTIREWGEFRLGRAVHSLPQHKATWALFEKEYWL